MTLLSGNKQLLLLVLENNYCSKATISPKKRFSEQVTPSNTDPRSGQYLTHAHSHITQAVAVVAGRICMSFEVVSKHRYGRHTQQRTCCKDMKRCHVAAIVFFYCVASLFLRKSHVSRAKFCPGVWEFGRLDIVCTKQLANANVFPAVAQLEIRLRLQASTKWMC